MAKFNSYLNFVAVFSCEYFEFVTCGKDILPLFLRILHFLLKITNLFTIHDMKSISTIK